VWRFGAESERVARLVASSIRPPRFRRRSSGKRTKDSRRGQYSRMQAQHWLGMKED
jgi:hypothetical protein